MGGIFDDYLDAAPAAPTSPSTQSSGSIFDDYLEEKAPVSSRTGEFADRLTPQRRAVIDAEVAAGADDAVTFGRVGEQVASGLSRFSGNVARTAGEIGKRVGAPQGFLDAAEEFSQAQKYRSEALQRSAGFTSDISDIGGVSDVGSFVTGQLLQSAPEVAATIINAPIGLTTSAASYMGSNLEAQIDEGNETDLLSAGAVAPVQAALDRFVGVERLVGGAVKGAIRGTGIRQAGGAGTVAKRVVQGALTEGAQEGAQQGLEEAARYQVAGEDYDALAAAKRVGKAAASGAIVGGVVNPVLSRRDGPVPSEEPVVATGTPAGIAGDARVDPLNISRENQRADRDIIQPDLTGMSERPALDSDEMRRRDQIVTPAQPDRAPLPDELDIFTGATPETLRPTSEGAVIRTIRGDLPMDKTVRSIATEVMTALNGGRARGRKGTVMPVAQRVALAYETLNRLSDSLDASPNIRPEDQGRYQAALGRAANLVSAYELQLEALGVPRTQVPTAPTVEQMAGPGVPIEQRVPAQDLGFASTEVPQVAEAVVNRYTAEQQLRNAEAQQQAQQARAEELGMIESAIPEAETLAEDAQAAQEAQAAQVMADRSQQFVQAQRQELVDSIIKGTKADPTPLQTFMRGLKRIDPEGLPTPEELAALAQYSSLSNPEKIARAEAQKPKLVPKAPQNEALLEPITVPAKMSKRQQRVQQARAEATALVPEAQQSPEIKSMLKALEDTARGIDNVFKSLINTPAVEGEQASLFEGTDPRVQPSQPRGFRQYVQNKIAVQDAKFEKQLAELQAAVVKATPAPAPEVAPEQAELFTAQKQPTKQALRLTKDQVAERIAEMEKTIPNDGLGAAKKLAVVPEIKALVETAPPQAVVDLMDAVSRPDVNLQNAVQLTQIVKDRYAAVPAPAPVAETAPVEPVAEESAPAVLDEEAPGVNVEPEGFLGRPRTPQPTSVTYEQAREDIARLTARWRNKPDIVLVDEARRETIPDGFHSMLGRFDGLYDPESNKVYIFAHNMTDRAHLRAVLYHEALGHYGLRERFGEMLSSHLRAIWNTSPELRREAQAWMRKYPGEVQRVSNTSTDPELYALEEVLVSKGETRDMSLMDAPTASVFERLAGFLSRTLAKFGLYMPNPMAKYDAFQFIKQAHEAVTLGLPTREAAPVSPMAALRGRPATPVRQPVGQEIIDAFASSDALNQFMLRKGITNPGVRQVAISARGYLQRFRLASMMGNTFADLADSLGLSDYGRLNQIKQLRNSLVNEKRVEIQNLMADADRLGETERTALQEFMRSYTLGSKHGFVPEFYSAADKAEVVVDPAAQAKVDAFRAQHPAAHAEMLKLMQFAYEERNAYTQAVQDYIESETRDSLADVTLTPAERRDIEERKARQLRMFNKAVPKLDGPYFPLGRFGEHMVVAESPEFRALQAKENRTKEENAQLEAMEADPNHYQVHFFESRGQAELLREEIAKQPAFSGAGARVTNAVKTDFFEQMGESPLLQMQKLRQMVMKDLPETSFDRDTKRKIDTLLSDLYVRSLAETSARKFDARRKKVEGSSTDMLRAFHDKMKADVASRAHVASFAGEMAIEKTLYDQVNADPTNPQYEARRDFLREYQDRDAQQLRLNMNRDSWASEMQNRVMLGSSFYHLFTMPRYYLMNMLQPLVYTAPKIGARHGMPQALSAMTDAYRSFRNVALTGEFFGGEINIDKLDLPADEKAFLKAAQKQGKLEFGQQLDFGEWNNAKTQAGRWSKALIHKLRTVSGQVEYINRTTAGVAAYRLEKARTGNADTATKYALRVIDDTQLDYSTQAQSRLFNMLPKVMTQFRKYQVGMLALQYGMMKNAVASLRKEGLSAAETQEAFKALAYSWGSIAAVSGVAGIPGMQLAAVMGAYMFGPDDEPLNGERWLRGQFSDDEMGLALRKGLPALAGLDMGNVGLGSILNPMPFFDYRQLGERGGAYEAIGQLLGGPAGGAVAGVVERGAQGGPMAALEQAMPSGIRAAWKGFEMATKGLERKNGDIIMTPDEIGEMKAVLQALGFRDLDAAEKMTRYYEKVGAEQYYRDRISEMKREYAEAQDAGNREAMQNLVAQWREMNEAKKRFDLKPTALSELYKARADRAKRIKKFRERAELE